jgi:pyruvate/2-oxoglutarate dehydrogenase complex dihydrolipoamide dehydrogenase (E3) component
MSFDYDLVIIGGSWVARSVAAKAGRLKARVALVEPESLELLRTELQCQIFGQSGRTLRAASEPLWYSMAGILPEAATIEGGSPQQWQTLLQSSHQLFTEFASNEDIGHSHSQLATFGVDVIVGQGQFERSPHRSSRSSGTSRTAHNFAFIVNHRVLRSRSYLLATGSIPAIPAIPGLETVNYHTIDSLWQQPWQSLPKRLVIVGSDPRGIALAQVLNRFGAHVTLITQSAQLLPTADREAVFLLQALLEAEGINLLTNTTITQVNPLPETIELQLDTQSLNTQTLETNALLLAANRHPNITALNLEAIGVQAHGRGVMVNTLLQTTCPHVYACGDVLGGYSLLNLATYEADVALHNTLFPFKKQVHYHSIPWAVLTDPPFAQVGLTEQQARAAYRDVQVLRQSYQSLLSANLQGEAIGLCQLIVRRDGEILGAQGVGHNAQEWIGMIALAMQRRMKLGAIVPSTFISPSFSEVISQLIEQWKTDRLSLWKRDWLEGWFNFQRS